VLENVTSVPRRVHKLARAAAETQAMDLLKQVGLADKRDTYLARLSGGRSSGPQSPARSLALELVGEVLKTMRGLAEQGMTMLVVTSHVADDVMFMDHRVVVEHGPPSRARGRSWSGSSSARPAMAAPRRRD
jgi:ABC-type histidine transport system ATPase subunit